jgi:hypothetical protein
MWRSTRLPLAGAALLVIVCCSLAGTSSAHQARTGSREIRCGTTHVFSQPFTIWVRGVPVSCEKARRITAQHHCAIRFHRQWSCLAFREAAPFVIWFPTDDTFKRHPATEILLGRYPCSKAHVNQGLFTAPSHGFPTRRQMLADDVVRCKMLADSNPEDAIALLGPPDEQLEEGRLTSLIFWLGPERQSLVEIDQEGLEVDFLNNRFNIAGIFQG